MAEKGLSNSDLDSKTKEKQKAGESTSGNFVPVRNEWKILMECCEKKCGSVCVKGSGSVKLINEESVEYVKGKDQTVSLIAKNELKNPKDEINYSLFYFEVKFKIEGKKNDKLCIGVKNQENSAVFFNFGDACIRYHMENKDIKKIDVPETFSWNDGDVFGCGIVYPPINKSDGTYPLYHTPSNDKLPYLFFTQNGKQIGKALLLMKSQNCEKYEPIILLKCCSAETNFGKDLKAKPFIYDVSKHSVADDFHVFEDNDADEMKKKVFRMLAEIAIAKMLAE